MHIDIGSVKARHQLIAIFYRLFFSYETLFNIENLPFEEKAILPDIYGSFDFKFCLGTRNFSGTPNDNFRKISVRKTI